MRSEMTFSVAPKKDTPREDYTVGKHGYATMKRNVQAFTGKCRVVADADEFWNAFDKPSKPYQSKVLENPTWGQLYACAKAAQKKTGDLHHSFFEGVCVLSILDGVTVLGLALGS